MAAIVKIQISQEGSGNAAQQAKKDIEELGQTAEKAGGGFSALHEIGVGALRELGAIGLNVLGSLAGKLTSFVSDGVNDAREAAKIMAQTEAVITSTGGAAGVSAQHVADLASSLSAAAGKSLFGDDQIQQSNNMLLTFTNVKGAVLDAATAVSVDMAQAFGGAPKDAAIQLGKALNDPVKGITALSRVGVTFTDDQKDMIQAMVDTGDVAGAQGVILAELNKEFGGSAEAAAKADGGMAQLKDQLGELGESIGTALLPIINQLVGFLITNVVPVVQQAADVFTAWLADPATQAGIQALAIAIQTGLGVAMDFLTTTAIPGLMGAWTLLQPAIAAILPLFESGGASVSSFGATFTTVEGVVSAVMTAINAVVGAVLAQLSAFWQAHGTEITAFVVTTWNQISSIIQVAMQLINATIVPILTSIAAFISSHGATIQALLSNAWTIISTIISTTLAIIQGVITAVLQAIKGDWSGAWDTIKGVLSTVWEAIKTIVSAALDSLKLELSLAWDAIKGVAEGAWDGIKGAISTAWDNIKTAVSTAVDGLKTSLSTAWDGIKTAATTAWDGIKGAAQTSWDGIKTTITGVIDSIKGYFTALPGQLSSIGGDIISGIVQGIRDSAGSIFSALADIAHDALQAAKDAITSGSPSKLFADEVGAPISQGIAMGITGAAPQVNLATRSAATAGLSGARDMVNTYNQQRALTINYNGLANAPAMDYATALTLSGMG